MRHLALSAVLAAATFTGLALTATAQPADEASDRADQAFEHAIDNAAADHEPPGQEAEHVDASDHSDSAADRADPAEHADTADHADGAEHGTGAAANAHEVADAAEHSASESSDVAPSESTDLAARTFAAADAVTADATPSGRRVGEIWWEWNSARDCWDEVERGAHKGNAPGVRCSVN